MKFISAITPATQTVQSLMYINTCGKCEHFNICISLSHCQSACLFLLNGPHLDICNLVCMFYLSTCITLLYINKVHSLFYLHFSGGCISLSCHSLGYHCPIVLISLSRCHHCTSRVHKSIKKVKPII